MPVVAAVAQNVTKKRSRAEAMVLNKSPDNAAGAQLARKSKHSFT